MLARGLLILCIFIVIAPFSVAQERPQEEVTVTVIEVPVRVQLKGETVRNLTREDFEVFENGKKQAITQFEVISRKIARPSSEIPVSAAEGARIPSRLFLLIFNIFDYNKAVGEVIDHFFREYFREGDQIIILIENRILDIERGKDSGQLVASLKDAIKKYKAISTMGGIKAFRDLGLEADRLLSALRGEAGGSFRLDQFMIRFFENYQRIWNDYRNQFLVPDVGFYQSLTKRIKSIEGEKWAICFQQRDIFPKLKTASRLDIEIRNWADSQVEPQEQVKARLVQMRQQELERSFNFSGQITPDTLSNLFLGADITFHLILMKSPQAILSQDFEFKEVGNEYENDLKIISHSTGGLAAFSNNPIEALKNSAEVEDYHYLLVYSPEKTSGTKIRNIEVRVKKSGMSVSYPKRFLEVGPLPVSIADLKVSGKIISFSVHNCQMADKNGHRSGLARVNIVIYDDASKKVFEEGKSLEILKDDTRISLNFSWLNTGSFFIIIEAVDLIAKQTDVYSAMIKL